MEIRLLYLGQVRSRFDRMARQPPYLAFPHFLPAPTSHYTQGPYKLHLGLSEHRPEIAVPDSRDILNYNQVRMQSYNNSTAFCQLRTNPRRVRQRRWHSVCITVTKAF